MNVHSSEDEQQHLHIRVPNYLKSSFTLRIEIEFYSSKALLNGFFFTIKCLSRYYP